MAIAQDIYNTHIAHRHILCRHMPTLHYMQSKAPGILNFLATGLPLASQLAGASALSLTTHCIHLLFNLPMLSMLMCAHCLRVRLSYMFAQVLYSQSNNIYKSVVHVKKK